MQQIPHEIVPVNVTIHCGCFLLVLLLCIGATIIIANLVRNYDCRPAAKASCGLISVIRDHMEQPPFSKTGWYLLHWFNEARRGGREGRWVRVKWGTCEDREGSKLESAVIKAAEYSCWAWATHGDTLAMRYLLYIPTLSSGHSNSGYSVSLCICLAVPRCCCWYYCSGAAHGEDNKKRQKLRKKR